MTVHFCGEAIDVEAGKDLYFCRCGQSQNAPFCDGSHQKVGFVAEPALGVPKEIRVWEGKTITTFFNPNTCMHAADCKPLKELRARELQGDTEAAAEIARVVQSCPSGALTYASTEVEAHLPAARPDIDIREGGELRIQRAFEINAAAGERQDMARATLCRCGESKNKPWCDGAHRKRADFR